MLKWIRKKMNQKGFTLIELVVVIAILGILAAIAIPRIGGFRDTANAQVNKQNAAQLKSAFAMALASGEIEFNDRPDNSLETLQVAKLAVKSANSDTKFKVALEIIEGENSLKLDASEIADIIKNYVPEIELKPTANQDQMIQVTLDDGGGVEAIVVPVQPQNHKRS